MFYDLDCLNNSELGLLFAEDELMASILPADLQRELEDLHGEADPESFCYVGGKIRGFFNL